MRMELFADENRQWDREFLGGYDLDARLFSEMGLRISQIVPARNAFRIATDKGFFSLKKLRFPVEDMDFVIGAMEHLGGRGFGNTFKIVRQRNGDSFLDFNGEKYYLIQWIDGRECNFMDPLDLDAAIGAMADLHRAAEGYFPEKPPEDRCYYGKWPESFGSRLKEMDLAKERIMEKPERNDIDCMYLDYVDMCIKNAGEALDLLNKSGYKKLSEVAAARGSFINHDPSQHNILHTFDGRTYMGDFDYSILDLRIHDLGSLILKNLKRCSWNIGKAVEILEGYDRRNPIDKDELRVLVPFFLFPQDFRQVSRQYDIERKPWDEDELSDKMDARAGYEQLRMEFIEEYQRKVL
ncbi:MAG TPA: CotS family spore coat protein [Negativicutes bacterium]|nr:CotS family spore coat protein [Negativicutes bacterium]